MNKLIIVKQSHKKLIEAHLITTGSILDGIIGSIPCPIGEINLVPNELETGNEIIDRLAKVLLDLILFNHELIFLRTMRCRIPFGKHIPR